jgi:hypothetical protein
VSRGFYVFGELSECTNMARCHVHDLRDGGPRPFRPETALFRNACSQPARLPREFKFERNGSAFRQVPLLAAVRIGTPWRTILHLIDMTTDTRLLELALKGLESERTRIDQEIADLKRRMNGRGTQVQAGRASSATRRASGPTKRRPGLTPEGRKRLSELAKKRWVANRRAGKTTL